MILTILTFLKAKNILYILNGSVTCVYDESEGKIKLVQEQRLQLKMKLLLGYNMKIVI